MRGPYKVLYILGNLDCGGTQFQLIRLLRMHDRTRYIPSVLHWEPNGALLETVQAIGIKAYCLPLQPTIKGRLRWLKQTVTFLNAQRFDIIHAMVGMSVIYGAVVAKLVQTQVIICSQRNLGYWMDNTVKLRFVNLIYRHIASGIVVNSEVIKTLLVESYHVDPAKVKVVHNGIDASVFDQSDQVDIAQTRRMIGCDPGSLIIGTVARLSPVKGLRELLEAVGIVRIHYPDIVLAIVGDGPQRSELEQQAKSLGIETNVRFLGERLDIPHLLSVFDLTVLSSHSEGFSNAIMEYMAAAKPVIASRVGGIPELVQHGKTGVLVPPRDVGALASSILDLLANPSLAKQMGVAGRARVSNLFTEDRCVRETEEYYDDLLTRTSYV